MSLPYQTCHWKTWCSSCEHEDNRTAPLSAKKGEMIDLLYSEGWRFFIYESFCPSCAKPIADLPDVLYEKAVTAWLNDPSEKPGFYMTELSK